MKRLIAVLLFAAAISPPTIVPSAYAACEAPRHAHKTVKHHRHHRHHKHHHQKQRSTQRHHLYLYDHERLY